MRGNNKLSDQKIVTLLSEWSNFTAEREAERHRLQNPPGIAEKKAELAEINQEIARLRAKQHLLKAQITMASHEEPYNKALFDSEWSEKKKELKSTLETLLMAEISGGKSIPTIMSEYSLRNPVWLYNIKDKQSVHQRAEASKLGGLTWEWSDFTGSHRYALARGESGEFAYVKMMGTIDTELEGESCVWEIATGELLSGSQEVFNSDSTSGRQKRATTLAAVLNETYSGPMKEAANPYYGEATQ